jgi:hypothetical protein
MGFETSGFDELYEDLNNMSKEVTELSKINAIGFKQLFSDSFIRRHTQFSTLNELFENSGFIIKSEEDFDTIDENELNKHLSAKTDFDSWDNMLGKAYDEYAATINKK